MWSSYIVSSVFLCFTRIEVESLISDIMKIGTTNPRLELLWNIVMMAFCFCGRPSQAFFTFSFFLVLLHPLEKIYKELSKEHAWFRVDVGFCQGGFVTSTGFLFRYFFLLSLCEDIFWVEASWIGKRSFENMGIVANGILKVVRKCS